MLHLYIDTNTFLSFFHLTSEDLEELRKLRVLITKTKEVTLHLPQQTLDEFRRNRDMKISDALKVFREEKLNEQFPQICKQYTEYGEMRAAIQKFKENKSVLLEKLTNDILTGNLEADEVTNGLFAAAKQYPTTPEILSAAKCRFDIGNPPGKNRSYGDAINWETLLANLPDEDLYFVSDDKDFYSAMDNRLFNSFLWAEWKTKKRSKIFSFRQISQFFKITFPNIKLSTEIEKDFLIDELTSSGSFARSRSLLNSLSSFENFSSQQLNDMVRAFVENDQIYGIRRDEDIAEMISNIVMPNRHLIEPDNLTAFLELYAQPEEESDDAPF